MEVLRPVSSTSVHALLLCGLLAVHTVPPGLAGQDMPSARAALADFEERGLGVYPGPMTAAEWVAVTIVHFQDYAPARVDSVLDGLGQVALRSPSGDIRGQAIAWLTVAGDARQDAPVPGVIERLETLLRGAVHPRDRVMIVRALPFQAAPRERILTLLERVLTDESPGEAYETPYYAAVQALKGMGPEGAEILCRVRQICSNAP